MSDLLEERGVEWKEEALDDLVVKDEKGSPSIRPTMEHVFIDTAGETG